MYLVLTVDYEIFGNGTGDVYRHVIEPASRLARLGQEYGVPFTFFFEVEEYLKHLEYKDVMKSDLGYDPANLMEEQVRILIKGGHDIQLHIHPQWVGARYVDNKWLLYEKHVTVDDLFSDQVDTTRYISNRKNILESIIKEVDPGRRIKAFRAGGFCAQPGIKLLSALADNKILIESSVVRGLFQNNGSTYINYRTAPLKKLWRVKDNVSLEDSSGKVYEIPIHSVMRRRFYQFSLNRLKAKFSGNIPRERKKEIINNIGFRKNPFQIARSLWHIVPIKLDFHNLSPGIMIRWIQSAMLSDDVSEKNILVLIGHTKEHINDRPLARFLKAISVNPMIQVVTFDWLAKALEGSAYGK